MRRSDSLSHRLSSVFSGMKHYRTLLLTLSAIVVFVVSYLLILPALTLDQDEANQQAGINLETEAVKAEANALSYSGDAFEVEAAYNRDAQLPEKTTLQVSEITKKNDQYQAYCDHALEAIQNADKAKKVTGFSFVKLYDISLMADGSEVEPNAPVNVSISYDKGLKAKRADHVRIIHFAEDSENAQAKLEILDNSHVDVTIEKDKMTEASFEAESFSVYGVVYTVDFEYEVDGNKYTYSIEGGSSISLKDLLTSLQVVQDDKNTEVNEVQLFVDDAQKVAFSSPDFVRVDHTDQGWTLTSLKPFTSTETLTVTMKNGDVFTVKVTDAQEIDDTDTVNVDKSYIICTHDDNGYHVLKTDGSVESFTNTNGFDALDNNYRWTFYYVFTEKDRETTLDYKYYFIRPIDDKSKTIALNGPGETPLIQEGTNNVAIIPQSGGGFWFKGYHNTELAYTNGQFVAGSSPSLIRIFEQKPLPQYSFTVVTDDRTMGKVSGYNESGTWQGNVDQYISITNEEKKNLYSISAVPVDHKNNDLRPWDQGYNQNKWIFDHWELNGEALDKNAYGQNINTNMLDIPFNSSVLKAVFKVNPNYVTPDNEKEGRTIDKAELDAWLEALENKELPLDRSGCKKTAEVYDYENRIYRVDLTSKASLQTFAGTIDLGFIIDVSASMNFPSSVIESDDVANHAAQRISSINDTTGGSWYALRTRGDDWGLSRGKTYYIIADPHNTATSCELYWSTTDNAWRLCDASQTDDRRFDPATGFEIEDGSKKKNYYDTNASYVIYEANDFVTQEELNDPKTGPLLRKLGLTTAGMPKTRSFYLENSLNGTGNILKEILQMLSLAQNSNQDPDVKIAWNTLKNYLPNGNNQRQDQFQTAKNGIDLNYDFNTYGGGTSTDIALLDAVGVRRSDVNNYNDYYSTSAYRDWDVDSYNSRSYYTEQGRGFNWNNSATKYAVLITDGAPQRGGKSIDSRYVQEAAEQLKNKGIKLITIGLSMENVEMGSVLLYDIADDGKDGNPLFYNAKSGDELQYALYEVIRAILSDATVQGDVTDQINEAFYPVDKTTGNPLKDGDQIDLNGNLVSVGYSGPEGTIVRGGNATSGYTYTVKWEDQDFPIDGWHGTVYVKAKEDLLGGNAVKTNQETADSTGAQINAKSYKVNPSDPAVTFSNDQQKLTSKNISLTTPRVNVNELTSLKNETEWTVYLGTEVDPKTELRKLYDSINIQEVVKKQMAVDTNGDGLPDTVNDSASDPCWYPVIQSITDDREPDGTGDKQEFTLNDLLASLVKGKNYDWWDYANNGPNWDRFLEQAAIKTDGEVTGIQIPYSVYGINDNSYIKITLDKQIVTGEESDLINHSPHETTVTGVEVEKYTFTVLYSPDYDVLPRGQGGSNTTSFQTGTFGTMYQGHAAGTETSENIHVINVYKKGLHITKTDVQYNTLPGAKFVLYRTARSGDDQSKVKQIDGLEGNYFPVADLDTSQDGTASINPMEPLNNGEKYYLVEEQTPEGYNTLDPVLVTFNLVDQYKLVPGGEWGSTRPQDGPYDWQQTATLSLDMSKGIIQTNANGEPITHTAEAANDDSELVYYKIPNSSGVELPYTGGSGTIWLYVLGALLVLLSGTGLMLKRRRDAA